MAEYKPEYRTTYSKPMEGDAEFPRGYRVACEEDDPAGDECTIRIASHEFRFGRSEFSPDRWDSRRDTLEWALQQAFDQGRAVQRGIMRDALGIPTAWGGINHGKSGT